MKVKIITLILFSCISGVLVAQHKRNLLQDWNSKTLIEIPSEYYQTVNTFLNPVLPGDHPDPTLLKVGDDFYMCGSSFHFLPYLPILHSKDLIHWEEINRVVATDWKALQSDAPGKGIWQGAITYFNGSYWIYFSNGSGSGQYFCKASAPKGPWSSPVKVNTTTTTGSIGYDNSIFVDDDGTPYMLIKSGKYVNRIQKIGIDGHLTGTAVNLDWMNADGKYSWAEGPVMCKKDNWYYYFIAGNVGGGQWVLRSKTLTSDSTKWEALGKFFIDIKDANYGFKSPNHMAAPIQLDDGTWWTIAHGYENIGNDDWSGQGRQGLLFQLNWDTNGKPSGISATSSPMLKPNLQNNGLPWRSARSDYFDKQSLSPSWHFLNKDAVSQYSLTDKNGWLKLTPDGNTAHILQKEGGHYYSLVTRVNVMANNNQKQAGIYITNGNQSANIKLYSGFENGKKVIFEYNSIVYQADNPLGDTLWLKIDRKEHLLKGFYSSDGVNWNQVGEHINASDLDKGQANYNSWVGNSIGLFAVGTSANFDLFLYRGGFSPLSIAGYNNAFGVQTLNKSIGKVVSNASENGGWLMLAGVDLGIIKQAIFNIEVEAASTIGGDLEVWIDDIENKGTKIATVRLSITGSDDTWKTFRTDEFNLETLSGQHDIYLRFPKVKNPFFLNTIKFIPKDLPLTTGLLTPKKDTELMVYPNPSSNQFSINSNSSPYTLRVHLWDMKGRLLYSDYNQLKIVNPNLQLFSNDLKSGIYILTIQTNNHIYTSKLIKN